MIKFYLSYFNMLSVLQIFLFFILMTIVICCIYSDIVYETFESKSHDENQSQSQNYTYNQSKQQPLSLIHI